MVDKALLYNQVLTKFKNLSLHSIVNECFIKGLFDEKTLKDMEANNKNDIEDLSRYSYATMEALGGYSMLTNAIKSCEDGKQKLLLQNIDVICTEASKKAAQRVAQETDTDKLTDSREVVSSAAFTKQEMSDFIKNGENIDTEKISEIIRDKTKSVIQEEQESFKRDEELESEISEILVSNDDSESTEEAKESFLSLEGYLKKDDFFEDDDEDESEDEEDDDLDDDDLADESCVHKSKKATETYNKYLNIVLDGNMPRHHVSLFSKLQEAAVEAVLRYGNDDLMGVVNHVTFESFLDSTKKPITANTCIESLIQMQKDQRFEEDKQIDMNKVMEEAMMSSMIIYTAMETFNTLNLFTPSRMEIKDFVDRSHSKSKSDKKCMESFDALVQEELNKFKNEIAKESSISTLSDVYSKLTQYKEDIDLITLQGNELFSEARESTLNTLDILMKLTKEKIDGKYNKALESNVPEDNGYYTNLNRRKDLSQFTKINYLIAKRPNVEKIQMNINPANESVVTVLGKSANDSVIATSFMNINSLSGSKAIESDLAELFLDSALADCKQRVSIYLDDGSGNETILK